MLKLLSYIFFLITFVRNKLYDYNIIKAVSAKAFVISIGNLSVGGTGKTPFAIMLIKKLKEKGYKVAYLSRGYQRSTHGELIVADYEQIYADASSAGDEAILIAQIQNVPVVVNNKKYQFLKMLDEKFSPDIIVCDDSFQHRKIKRDLDIVILDQAKVDEQKILPKGRLREPYSSLKRADVVAYYSHIDISSISEYTNDKLILGVKYWIDVPILRFKNNSNSSVYNNYYAFCSIAKPKMFEHSLNFHKLKIKEFKAFADHFQYKEADVLRIIESSKAIRVDNLITTEKDFVKLHKYKNLFHESKLNLWIIPAEIRITDGEDKLFSTIDKLIGKL